MFFSSFCAEAGKEVLLGPDRFIDMRDGPHGFELHFRCYCDRPGVVFPKVERVGRCGEAPRLRPGAGRHGAPPLHAALRVVRS